MDDPEDDLFRPTVQAQHETEQQPYQGSSTFYPAFFGGPMALLWFARRNADRYGLPAPERRRVVGTCTLLFLLGVLVAAALADEHRRGARFALQGAGVVAYVLVQRQFAGPERRRGLRLGQGGFERVGFWRGLGVVLAVGLAQAVLVGALDGATP